MRTAEAGRNAHSELEKKSLAGRIHSLTMLLQLPDEGIRRKFPDEQNCRDRFVENRWPAGITCPKCSSPHAVDVPCRNLFHCPECRAQFSPISGTALHGSRLPLQMWFLAVDEAIRIRALSLGRLDVTVRWLAGSLGIHNEAALRMRRIVLEDIRIGGDGLLGRAVCVKILIVPTAISPGSPRHLEWLISQMMHLDGDDC